MTRRGKIARLPKDIRTTLNERLHDGHRADHLVQWLNTQKPVKKILAAEFEGRDITEQNLSEWKNGGYQDWLRTEDSRHLAQQIKEQSGDITADNDAFEEGMATVLAAELMKLAQTLMNAAQEPQARWQQLTEVSKELSRLRRDKARETRRSVHAERWSWERKELERIEAKREHKRIKKQQLAPLELIPGTLSALASLNGGGEHGYWRAARVLELQHDLPEGRLQFADGSFWHWTGTDWQKVMDPTVKYSLAEKIRAHEKEQKQEKQQDTPPKMKSKSRRNGVRPSSGAAMPKLETSPESSTDEPLPNLAVAGDGHPPEITPNPTQSDLIQPKSVEDEDEKEVIQSTF